MKQIIFSFLIIATLCGFGAGPFWGQNVSSGGSGGGIVEVNTTGYGETGSHITPASISFDTTGADLLVGVSCGLRGADDNLVSNATQPTFNGTSMVNAGSINFGIPNSSNHPDCVLATLELTAPNQGVYNYAITFENTALSSTHWLMAYSGANTTLTNIVEVEPASQGTTISANITPTAVGNLLVFAANSREGDKDDCVVEVFTRVPAGDFKSGPNAFNDTQMCIGVITSTDTSQLTPLVRWFAGAIPESVRQVAVAFELEAL